MRDSDARPAQPDAPIRLLLVTDTALLGTGGSERFLRNLVARLPRERYRITLAQLGRPPTGGDRSRGDDLPKDMRTLFLPVDAVYGAKGWRAYRALRRLVAHEGFDVIQSQHEKSDVLAALLPRGAAGAVRISNRRDTGFSKSWRVRALLRRLDGRFDRIVAPADAILDRVAADEGVPRERMQRICNGVDAERFAPADAALRTALRERLGFGEREFVLGCVSRLTPVKRHAALIDAFAQLHARMPQARLVLVGDGPLRADIGSRIAAAGVGDAVRLLGDLADVADVLPALDACALVSETEGMSNAILEAMACGLPVVATAVGGNPELVAHEQTGLLVTLGDGDALAAALARLAGDPAFARECGRRARARVLADFSIDAMAEAFQVLHRTLLAQARRGR